MAGDFCYHAGRFYLIVVDCYSDWPTIIPMGRNITTSHLNAGLRELFSRTAIPDIFWWDRGSEFTSREFQSFACQWGFHHQTSTPHYPQSNGRVETAVKSIKTIIRAAWNGRCINEERSYVGPFCSFGTHHQGRMESYTATLSKMYSLLTTVLLHWSGNIVTRQQSNRQKQP